MTLVDLLDPLRRCPDGRYEDTLVIVDRGARPGVSVRVMPDGRIHVRHRLAVVDDDLAEALAVALSPVTDSHAVFTRAFTGIVLTSDPDPLLAWENFYRATLRRTGGYDDVYRHAVDLLPHSTVLDLGCGFGLLSLRLAERGARVLAADCDPGALRLLREMSARLGPEVDVLDTTAGLPDACVDAVALVHVLEHVPEDVVASLLDEAMRLARRTVVVGVPFESTPNPLYGHVRTYTPRDLYALGERSGWAYDVQERAGGWLVASA